MNPRARRRPVVGTGRSQNGSGGTAESKDTSAGRHPARYTPAIVDVLEPTIAGADLPVFDPFAGTGERLGALCDRLSVAFSGVDIEAWPGRDRRVAQGDATAPASYPVDPHLIVTSPTYGNGMNDHYEARDGSPRANYRHALGRPLDERNTGRYGIRRGARAWHRYWTLHAEAVDIWAARGWPVAVNVKGFVCAGEVVELPLMWQSLLEGRDYLMTGCHEVPCPGYRRGENHDARLDHEVILCAEIQ